MGRIIGNFKKKYGPKQRLKKYNQFLSYMKPTKMERILDIGPTDREVFRYENLLESQYPYPEQITALGIENFRAMKEKYPLINVVIYNGRKFPFQDKSFDIGFSNAVLEHVGDIEAQLSFLMEIRRTCRRGMITTPNRYFPIETHTYLILGGYLPLKFFYWIMRNVKGSEMEPGKLNTNPLRLLSRRELIKMLKLSGYREFKIFPNRFIGFVATWTIVYWD
jgi:SAM-dependent methyltransferase